MPKNLFQPGAPKPPNSGRKKGSGNKQTIAAICAASNCDPAQVLIDLMLDSKEDSSIRLRASAELLQYLHPKKRSIEQRFVDGEGNDREMLDLASVRAYMQSVE